MSRPDAPAFRFQWIEQLTPDLIAQWSSLARTAHGPASFCHLPEWSDALARHLLNAAQRLYFVAAYQHTRDSHADRLVALWPLMTSTERVLGLPIRSLSSPDHDHADRYDPPIAADVDGASLVRAWLVWLDEQATIDWDVLRLKNLPAEGALGQALQHQTPPVHVHTLRVGRYVETPTDPEQQLAEVSTSFRRNLRRLERRAQSMGDVAYDVITDDAQLAAALERFIAIEADGWKGDQGQSSAIACSEKLRCFYGDLTQRLGQRGECEIRLMRLGEIDIAGQWCLRAGDGLSILKIGYRESHQAIAPGNLLMLHTLLDACNRPEIQRVSFLTDPPWSGLWKAPAESILQCAVYRRGHARARWAWTYATLRRHAASLRKRWRRGAG